MAWTKPTTDSASFVLADSKRSHFNTILAEVLLVTRRATLDLANASMCVATFQRDKGCVAINTTQRLSNERVREIISEVGCFDDSSDDPATVIKVPTVLINEQPFETYQFDDEAPRFQQQKSFPLSIGQTELGMLLVATFSSSFDLSSNDFLSHFEDDFSKTLSILWDLNRAQNETLKTLVSAILDGVILCGMDTEIRFVNQAALRMLHQDDRPNWVGKRLEEFDVPHLTEFLQEALKNNLFELNKVINAPQSRSRLLGVHTQLLRDTKNREIGWMIALRDVTMTWQNDQMRSALSIASHEIKTPLNSICGAVDLLLEKDLGELNKDQTHCLGVIKDDVNRLNRLLNDILDLSRFDEGVIFIDRRKEISLDFLVNKVISSFGSFAGRKNIGIVNKIPKKIPTFKGDRDRLQQVLSNLIENSIKYSLPDSEVEIHASLESSVLNVTVKDEGVGIPEAEWENIFGRFKQLDNCPDHGERGYGLGLAIAREIIAASGGRIWVESAIGKGSTFHFTIPV